MARAKRFNRHSCTLGSLIWPMLSIAMLNTREFALAVAIVLALSWWFIDRHILDAAIDAFR